MEIPVYSFVAYSGTGKTTMLEKLVRELKSRGLRVAVIKHDSHDFEIDKEGKDTWRMSHAGADTVAIVSAAKSAVMINRTVSFEEIIGHVRDVDLILTEGYKTGSYPKIALRRKASGNDFAVPPETCIALMSDTPVDTDIPCFSLEDICDVADFIISHGNIRR